ncbi:MAG TPA: class I tRNA ligase family protein, partial [Ignavibacteria bacterium]|nr:class I tRNA ligase family protein [Ignavibacteria bacterium]
YMNEISKLEVIPRQNIIVLVKLLAPFAPHLAEELWTRLGESAGTITYEAWPEYDASKIEKSVITIVGQVNGKIRVRLDVENDLEEAKLLEAVKNDEKMKTYIDGKQIVKEIVVKNKLVNIVVK